MRLGLFLDDNLGGRGKLAGTRTLDLWRNPEGAPILPRFTKGFDYFDGWVDDARPVVLNAVGAAEKGPRCRRAPPSPLSAATGPPGA